MSDARTIIEAEDPKAFLKDRSKHSYRVVPIGDAFSAATVFHGNRELHNVILFCHKSTDDPIRNNDPKFCQELADYLNWLRDQLPWPEQGGWLPNNWLRKADELRLPEKYTMETGRPAFKREGKTGVVRVLLNGVVGEAEDPKSILRQAKAAAKQKLACPNCDAIWTEPSSVRRHYVPNNEEANLVFCYGHYTPNGDFEPDESPGDLTGYDLTNDSDQCAGCLLSTMTFGKMPGYVREDSLQEFNYLLGCRQCKARFFYAQRGLLHNKCPDCGSSDLVSGDELRQMVTHPSAVLNAPKPRKPRKPRQPKPQVPQAPAQSSEIQWPKSWSPEIIAGLKKAAGLPEAEDPKGVFKKLPRLTWHTRSFGGQYLWFECDQLPLVAFTLHWGDAPEYKVTYRRLDKSNYEYSESFTLPSPDTNEAARRAKTMASRHFSVLEAEDPKSVLRQAANNLWLEIDYVEGQKADIRVPVKFYSQSWQMGTEVGLSVPNLDPLVAAHLLNQDDADELAIKITDDLNGNPDIIMCDVISWESHIEYPDGHELTASWTLQAPRDVKNWLKRKLTRTGHWSAEEDAEFVRRFGEARFDQKHGKDFTYGSVGNAVIFTPLTEKAGEFIRNLLMPGSWLADGGYLSSRRYAQQILAQAGDEGLVGRQVVMDVYDLQHFRPPLLLEEDPKSTLKHATADKVYGWLVNWTDKENKPRRTFLYGKLALGTFGCPSEKLAGYLVRDMFRRQVASVGAVERMTYDQFSAMRRKLGIVNMPPTGLEVPVTEGEDPKSIFRGLPRPTWRRVSQMPKGHSGWQEWFESKTYPGFTLKVIDSTSNHYLAALLHDSSDSYIKSEWLDVKDMDAACAVAQEWATKVMPEARAMLGLDKPQQEAEDPKSFLKQHGDYVVMWAFGNSGWDRYRIVRGANGPEDAIEKWKVIDKVLLAKAPPDQPPKVLKVYRYRDSLARPPKQEAEDPKHFLNVVARKDRIVYCCPFTTKGDTEAHDEYFSFGEDGWTPRWEDATPEHLARHVKDGVLDLNDLPLGTESVIFVNADGSPGKKVSVDELGTRYKVIDTYRSPEDLEVDVDGLGVLEAEDPKQFLRTNAPRLWKVDIEMTAGSNWVARWFYSLTPDKKQICDLIHKRYPDSQLSTPKVTLAPPAAIAQWRKGEINVLESEDPKRALRSVGTWSYRDRALHQALAERPAHHVEYTTYPDKGTFINVMFLVPDGTYYEIHPCGPFTSEEIEELKKGVLREVPWEEYRSTPEGFRERVESMADDIAKEAEKAEQPKSQEQAAAGNQKKGHIHLHGWEIAIENAKDSIRKSKDPENPWQVMMPAHYGYIKGTVGKDKDHIDVYIGEHPSSMLAFVVNQVTKEGKFDEHKIMLGFKSKDEAIATYDKAFNGDLGPKLRKDVISATIDQVKHWLDKGDPKKEYANLEEAEDPKNALRQVKSNLDNAHAIKVQMVRDGKDADSFYLTPETWSIDSSHQLIWQKGKAVWAKECVDREIARRKADANLKDSQWSARLIAISPEEWEPISVQRRRLSVNVGEAENPKGVFKNLPRHEWSYTVTWSPGRDSAQVIVTHGRQVVNNYTLRRDEEEFEDWDGYPDSLGKYWVDWYVQLDAVLPYKPEEWKTFLEWYEKAYDKKTLGGTVEEAEDPKGVFKKLPRPVDWVVFFSDPATNRRRSLVIKHCATHEQALAKWKRREESRYQLLSLERYSEFLDRRRREGQIGEAEDPKSIFKKFNRTPEETLKSYGFEIFSNDRQRRLQTWTKVTNAGWWRVIVSYYKRNPLNKEQPQTTAGHIEWQMQLMSWDNDDVLKDTYGSGFETLLSTLREYRLDVMESEDPKATFQAMKRRRTKAPSGLIAAITNSLDELRGVYSNESETVAVFLRTLEYLAQVELPTLEEREYHLKRCEELLPRLRSMEFMIQAEDLEAAIETLCEMWGMPKPVRPDFVREAEDPKRFLLAIAPRPVSQEKLVELAQTNPEIKVHYVQTYDNFVDFDAYTVKVPGTENRPQPDYYGWKLTFVFGQPRLKAYGGYYINTSDGGWIDEVPPEPYLAQCKADMKRFIDQLKPYVTDLTPVIELEAKKEPTLASLAEKLLEAEDPKAFLRNLPKKALPANKVRISVRFTHDHTWSTVTVPVIWHKGMVSTGEGWMAGIDLDHSGTPRMPGLDEDQWQEILELVEYHLMEGDGDDEGFFQWEPDDERGVPYDRVEWKFLIDYVRSQRKATEYFGGVIP